MNNLSLIIAKFEQISKKFLNHKLFLLRRNSVGITDTKIIQKFTDDLNFPFLVSFPRTGSHWLRMVMELYFKKPSLTRAFYYRTSQDYLTFHTHDIDLDVYRKNVLYLYRDPGPTIYSQMVYYQEDINDEARIRYWSSLYGRHLSKWLIEETQTEKKTILKYEYMVKNIENEFSKITSHFGTSLNSTELKKAVKKVTKNEVKQKSIYNQQVINTKRNYQIEKENFLQKYETQVIDVVITQNEYLQSYF